MKAHSEEIRRKVLDLLTNKRSYKEIVHRTGISAGTIEDWATDWRKDGSLPVYVKEGMEFAQKAKIMSNGYYPILRKRYNGMKWTDKVEGRTFGFNSQIEAIHYFLDETGNPRPCTYCGLRPAEGKVWGLDRLDSLHGHIPGNLVPCCSSNPESPYMSCQTSKSKFSLEVWMQASLSRAYGFQVSDELVHKRLEDILCLAKSLQFNEKGAL
jgi:transposase